MHHRFAKLRRRIASSLSALALAACGSDPAGPAVSACAEGIHLTVSRASAGPTLDWKPRCAVSFVAIVRADDYTLAWGIRTPTPRLTPPQQAYVTPGGAYELGTSRALRPGASYTIILGVRDTNSVTGAIGERAVATLPYVP